jgi:sigma-B regulation protein RsbU (phosphoserine phosphatase)
MSILIVDDSSSERLLLESFLKAKGHTNVVLTESPAEAFRYLGIDGGSDGSRNGRLDVDLILMDIVMPDMNGIEACRQIKSFGDLRDIPIIMVTANAEIEDLQSAFAAGAMDYITKPVKKLELLARVGSALALKRETDARKLWEQQLIERNRELEKALEEVKTLRGFISICSSCKNIRNDQGKWEQLEAYIQQHSEALFSHGICLDCMKKLYPDFAN